MANKIMIPGKLANGTVNQYHFVTGGTAPDVAISGAAESPIGIAENEAADNAEVKICAIGLTQLVVDGSGTAITVGCPLKPDASGHGVIAETDADVYSAVALEATSSASVIIDVLAIPCRVLGHT